MVIPPIIVTQGDDCSFYPSVAAALAAGISPGSVIFDGTGQHLLADASGGLVVAAGGRDGEDELAGILREWLGANDAIRWSVANCSLSLLLRMSIEHLGWS